MNKIFLLIIIFGFLSSCHNSIEKIDEIGEDEKQIINIVFDEIIGPDSSMKKCLLPIEYIPEGGFQSAQEKSDHMLFLKITDSLKTIIDTTKLRILINDSIIKYPKKQFPILLDNENFKWNCDGVDTSFRSMILKLVDSTYSKKLDISYIKSKYNYQIEFKNDSIRYKYYSEINSYNYLDKISNYIIGYVDFSRTVFNNNKNKACIYAALHCGPLCGFGTIFFLQKENNKWIVKGSGYGWVS